MIDGFLPTAAVDAVGVFDKGFNQLFADARPIKISVAQAAKAMTHPIESGAMVTDHRIILPLEIELTLALSSANHRSTYRQIRELFLKGDTLIVQTKSGCYPNMLITAMPHDEEPDTLDALMMTLKLKEVMIAKAKYEKLPARKVKRKHHTSTVKRGEQSGKSTKKKSSMLYDIFF